MATVTDIVEALRETEEDRGIHFMLNSFDREDYVSYRQLAQYVDACEAAFQDQGVQEGTRVLFPFETGPWVIASFLALIQLGALPMSVRPHHPGTSRRLYTDFADELMRRYGVNAVLATPAVQELELSCGKLALPRDEAEIGATPSSRPRPRKPEELAFVQFSSGSTSFPKGVPVTNASLYEHAQRITEFDGRQPHENLASWLPLYHDMGLIGGLVSCLYARSKLYLSSPIAFLRNPIGWLDLVSQKAITVFPTPNFALDYTIKRLEASDNPAKAEWDFSSLKNIYIGSEPINPVTLERFYELLSPFGLRYEAMITCYGMAEAVLMVTAQRRGGPKFQSTSDGRRYVSVGEPVNGIGLRITSNGRVVNEEMTFGEIEIRGGHLVEGYFEQDRPIYNEDGYFATGDFGFWADDEVYIAGRDQERIILHGENYFSVDFERVIEELEFVKAGRVAVTQVDGDIHVAMEPSSLGTITRASALRERVQAAVIEAYGIELSPEHIHFVRRSEISKTSSGKLQRNQLAERIRKGQLKHSNAGGYLIDDAGKRLQRLRWAASNWRRATGDA